jgi:ribonuclease HI
MHTVIVYTDGGSRGNPGPAAIGIVICDENSRILKQHCEFIGVATNNRAEYRAIIKALELAAHYTDKKVMCFLDSLLVINQLRGLYKIRKKRLLSLFYQVKTLEKKFEQVTYEYASNLHPIVARAHMLVNAAFKSKSKLKK